MPVCTVWANSWKALLAKMLLPLRQVGSVSLELAWLTPRFREAEDVCVMANGEVMLAADCALLLLPASACHRVRSRAPPACDR